MPDNRINFFFFFRHAIDYFSAVLLGKRLDHKYEMFLLRFVCTLEAISMYLPLNRSCEIQCIIQPKSKCEENDEMKKCPLGADI